MNTLLTRKKLLFPLTLFVAFMPLASTFAGTPNGALLHAPVATDIPTLSGTMLFVLSLLLVAVSFRIAKQKNSGTKHFVIALLGVGALISAGGGMKLMSDAHALSTHTMTATGGSLPIVNNDLNTYNNPGNPQRITGKTLPPANGTICPDTNPPGSGLVQCVVNMIVATGGSCSINCVSMTTIDPPTPPTGEN